MTTTTTTTAAPPATPQADPGLLPQTAAVPDSGPALTASMNVLWNAIVAGRADPALAVFFPRSAYLHMKTGLLADPAEDYANRLIAFYRLDIAAYHAYLGAGAASARFQEVSADPSLAAWIPPGACENLVGYWHLPGIRLVYSEDGVQRSFGVASLISWRGVWYIVHLGPNPRPSPTGTVDQPATGAGEPGPPGGC